MQMVCSALYLLIFLLHFFSIVFAVGFDGSRISWTDDESSNYGVYLKYLRVPSLGFVLGYSGNKGILKAQERCAMLMLEPSLAFPDTPAAARIATPYTVFRYYVPFIPTRIFFGVTNVSISRLLMC